MDGGVLASWVAALANLILVGIGVWSVRYQVKRQWLSNSATLISSFEQQFGSPEMIRAREKLARMIQEELQSPKDDRVLTGYWPVLSFFDGLGVMVRREAIDEELVWNRFGWRVTRCYIALMSETNLLEKTRKVSDEPMLYEEFVWLGKEMEKKYKSLLDKSLDPKRVTEEYVAQESTLSSGESHTGNQLDTSQGKLADQASKERKSLAEGAATVTPNKVFEPTANSAAFIRET